MLLLVAAAVATWIFRQKVIAGYLFGAGALLYLFFASGFAAAWLMGSLETEFPPGQDLAGPKTVDTVVVLTGYAFTSPHRPISGYVNSASAARILEASRLVERDPKRYVIISGHGRVPEIMKELLSQLGVRRSNISIEQQSDNTYASAVHLRERLAGKTFYLVTSAGHMPRAMGVFRKQELNAIPAPTDYRSPVTVWDQSLIPSGRNLAVSDLAMHEYLGILWYRLLGRI